MPSCKGRANLARVYVLVDARHGLKPADDDVLGTLDQAAVNYQVVLTKADQVKDAELAALLAATAAALAKHPAAYPDVLATSARSGAGMAELRAAIARLSRSAEHERRTRRRRRGPDRAQPRRRRAR